jgi:hypothetical protein
MSDDPSEQVAALAGGLERAARRLDRLEGAHRALADAVAGLADPGKSPDPGTPTLEGAPEAAVVDLLDWLADVYLAYDGATLAPCWAWHPGVVEELAVLRGIHRAIYAEGDWLRLGDWHDRYRPGVVRRVSQALAACDITQHQGACLPRTVPLSDALGPIYAARAAKTPIPVPTDEQATRARAFSTRVGGRS